MNIHLASNSKTRGKLLKNAKIRFSRIDHGVDENEVKISLQNQSPTEIAIKSAMIMSMILGGIKIPNVPEAAITPHESAWLYP